MKPAYLIVVLLFCASNIHAQINLDSGLVAYYPFYGNADDESGNDNNGMVFGATLVQDRSGMDSSAYYFDGNAYIKAAADNLPTGERTSSLWFITYSLYTHPVLLGYGGNGPPGTSWWMNINHGGTPPGIFSWYTLYTS